MTATQPISPVQADPPIGPRPPVPGPPTLNNEGSSSNRSPSAVHCPPSLNNEGSNSTGPRSVSHQATGPRTPAGKARSSQNARTHGLSAVHLVVRDDEREEFTQLEERFLVEIQPSTWLEMESFRHLVHAAWNLRRLERLEAELFDSGTDPLSDPDLAPTLDRYARYHQRHQRAYYRALKELKALQTERGLQQIALERQELTKEAPPLADNMKLTKRSAPLDVWQTFQRLLDREGGERAFLTLLEMVEARFGKSCRDFNQLPARPRGRRPQIRNRTKPTRPSRVTKKAQPFIGTTPGAPPVPGFRRNSFPGFGGISGAAWKRISGQGRPTLSGFRRTRHGNMPAGRSSRQTAQILRIAATACRRKARRSPARCRPSGAGRC